MKNKHGLKENYFTVFSKNVELKTVSHLVMLFLPTKLLALLQASNHDGWTMICPPARPHKNLTVRRTYM